jgi:hypothetical protein
MGLSSNTLIHLTLNKESLIGILKEGFKIKYCNEHMKTKAGEVNAAFPMVSFSDIPLSELGYHIDSYGSYGIGLKKSWAKAKGLNPVLYVDEDSSLGFTIRNDFKALYDKLVKGEIESEMYETCVQIMSYCKNYEGTLKTKKIKRENYRFSDEREWRYVPNKDSLGKAGSHISSSMYNTEEKKKQVNGKLSDLRLTFDPDDINYLFVENENEITEIIDCVRVAHSDKPYSSVERLFTRILTTQQIKTDI